MIDRYVYDNADESQDSSPVDLSLDEFVELLPCDCLSSVAAHRVNYLDQLLFSVSVFQLIVDVAEIVQVEFALGLDVQKGEVSSTAFFVEGVSLSHLRITTLWVSSLRNCSKSRGAP